MISQPGNQNPPARQPVSSMSDTPLSLLNRVFGYPAFRGEQAAIVDTVVAGGDALVLMPTGGGKSLCYQIPALLRDGCAVVVSPLIALMQDQVAALQELGIAAEFLNSSLDGATAMQVEREFVSGQLKLLYVAPERLLTPRFQSLLEQARVCAVRHRRSALRVAMGARFPPGIPRPVGAARALSRRAAHRAHRHRRHRDARRNPHPARPRRRARVRRQLRPPQHPLSHFRKIRPAPPVAGFPGRAQRRGRHRLLQHAQEGRGNGGRAQAGRLHRAALPRRHGQRDASPPPGKIPARGRRRHGRHPRVRHGHRQARRALRRPPRSAALGRGLLPGNRPRRPRRRARRGVDGVGPAGRRHPAPLHRRGRGRRRPQAHRPRQARCPGRPVRSGQLPPRRAA